MIQNQPENLDDRVLLFAPTARDSATSRDLLAVAGVRCFICNSIEEVYREAGQGAAAGVITAEGLLSDKDGRLLEWLKCQPTWSDFPLVILTPSGTDSPGLLKALEAVGNMTLMKRPVQVSTFVSTVKSALRDRRRQYSVREFLAERTRAEDLLKQVDRRKDDFIALLAHELRNPLAPIRNGLQVMRLAGNDATAVAQARGMMDRQLGHMVRLIDDLLDISRISRNKMDLRRTRVLLGDVISNAVETARPAIEAAGHELTVSLPAQPIFLDADLTRLAQVFGNLLSNSAKYTDRGGHIWLNAAGSNGRVTVSVRDNGIGVPAHALPRIFDMFSQVDRSIERSTGGLGIGLALVKALVEMHGGTVVASSTGQGKGSTFTVLLPALETPSEPFENTTSEIVQGVKGPKRRILVADDNRDSAESMATMLKLMGNDVTTAHDGIEAVAVADQVRPQAILMDIGMPRLNGLEATRRIRAQAWGQSIVIVALTGWGQDGDRIRSEKAGCDGHLVKPVNLPDLEKLLAALMSRNRNANAGHPDDNDG
jgi:signal transduction histidine kinase/ActR/RegA family two-component response regulator